MLIRTVFLCSYKSHLCNTLLNGIRFSSKCTRVSSLLGSLPKHSLCGDNNPQFVRSFFNCFFQQFHLKHSKVLTVTHEVESLCKLLESNKGHENARTEELKDVLSLLLSKGYSCKDILDNFSAFLMSENWSLAKFKFLEDIDSDIVPLLPLLSFSVSLLKTIAKSAKTDKRIIKEFSNRIHYLSHHLELEPEELIPILAKHLPLLTMNFKRLDVKMSILKNANISSKYIVKDLWIFNYNEQLLASRIQTALKAGVELKPWMLRCSDKFFEALLVKHSETNRILNGETVQRYLARKLNCKVEYVDYLMEKNKLLKKINVPKIEQILNFLFEKGYTPDEIRLFPRVFSSSVDTLRERFELFKLVRSSIAPTLAQLCLSDKNMQIRLKKLS